MAEDPERPAQTLQDEEHADEATVETNELFQEDTDGQEEQIEAASDHSRPRYETSRPHEDRSDRIRRSCSAEIQALQTFRCWHNGIASSEIEEFVYGNTVYATIRWPMNLLIYRASTTICTTIAAFRARRCRLWGLGFTI